MSLLITLLITDLTGAKYEMYSVCFVYSWDCESNILALTISTVLACNQAFVNISEVHYTHSAFRSNKSMISSNHPINNQ